MRKPYRRHKIFTKNDIDETFQDNSQGRDREYMKKPLQFVNSQLSELNIYEYPNFYEIFKHNLGFKKNDIAGIIKNFKQKLSNDIQLEFSNRNIMKSNSCEKNIFLNFFIFKYKEEFILFLKDEFSTINSDYLGNFVIEEIMNKAAAVEVKSENVDLLQSNDKDVDLLKSNDENEDLFQGKDCIFSTLDDFYAQNDNASQNDVSTTENVNLNDLGTIVFDDYSSQFIDTINEDDSIPISINSYDDFDPIVDNDNDPYFEAH